MRGCVGRNGRGWWRTDPVGSGGVSGSFGGLGSRGGTGALRFRVVAAQRGQEGGMTALKNTQVLLTGR